MRIEHTKVLIAQHIGYGISCEIIHYRQMSEQAELFLKSEQA